MKIERFEDIQAWQKARQLVNEVYKITTENERFSKDYGLKDQLRRASVSIMSNIAEGFSRRSTNEFTQFLFIAKGSAAEAQSQLYIALDQSYIGRDKFDELYSKSDEVARLISGFIRYLLSKLNKPKKLK